MLSNKNKYISYCRDHVAEFKSELRDEAAKALSSWPGRTAALLLSLSTLITYYEALSTNNQLSSYLLFAYFIPVSTILLFPIISLFISTIEKYGPQIMDFVCISGLFGFCATLFILFSGAESAGTANDLYQPLQGQIAFVLALSTAFAFHSNFYVTTARNLVFTLISSLCIYLIDPQFFAYNKLPVIEGFFLGSIVSWVFFDSIRARFYLKSTDANARQHLYNQLSKLVYPHQLEQIKLGDELENTMPLKEGKAIINVFDVQRSSGIRHEKTQEFFMGVFQAFLEICMKGYEHNPLRSRAFRLKETGDGFISSVGYPFLPTEARSLADSALSTALEMFAAFNQEVKKFGYSRPIKGAMGLAYNSVQGTFQSGGIRSYDLFGDALIQAAKYEELRKQPLIWKLISDHAREIGLEHFNILIIQETVYNSLSLVYRDLFVEIDLKSNYFSKSDFQLLYDNEARYIYFHLLN